MEYEYKYNYPMAYGVVPEPVENPLIIRANGYNYWFGRPDVTHYITVFPYQQPEERKSGLLTSMGERATDAYNWRHGLILEISPNAFDERIFTNGIPNWKPGDWISYVGYQLNLVAVSEEAIFKDGRWMVSGKSLPPLTLGTIRSEYVFKNYGPDSNPEFINTKIQISR